MIDLSRPAHTTLHSFCILPQVTFETQDHDENILIVLRAHPITQLPWIISGLILIILLVLFDLSLLTTFLTAGQLFYINIFTLVIIGAFLYFNFLNYFFNVGIITNKRVVDLDYQSVIYKEFTEARLGKIEDITSKSGGYFASLFNYGDVFIQTAGPEANVEFLKNPRPQDVVDIINELST